MIVKWMPVVLIVATSVCGWGQSQMKQRYALTAKQVAQNLSSKGVQPTSVQVLLLARVVATEPDPALDVLSVGPLGEQSGEHFRATRFLVKMACHLPGRCLPFYAVVSPTEASAGHAMNSSGPLEGLAVKQNSEFTIRTGMHATLVMDEEHAHIEVAVVSLENGVTGQKIRVASPDHKQIYVAEVVSTNLLKRSF
jgi:hypothetical protein